MPRPGGVKEAPTGHSPENSILIRTVGARRTQSSHKGTTGKKRTDPKGMAQQADTELTSRNYL
ncbi:hypothetical protein M9458_057836, partial [Cirrhinus mrigala]